jgi:hypothetical protein
MANTTEKKQLISASTLKNVKTVEDKIAKALLRLAAELNCSLTEDLYVRIVGREDDYPAYVVYNKNIKIKEIVLGELIELNFLEKQFVSEQSIEENIYRSLRKILIGFDSETKLSDLEVWIYSRTENGKPLFYLYKKGKDHKLIRSYEII